MSASPQSKPDDLPKPSALDVAAYAREMSGHLARMSADAGLNRLAGLFEAAAWLAAAEAGRAPPAPATASEPRTEA